MSPALLKDLEASCHILGISPWIWASLLIISLASLYPLGKSLTKGPVKSPKSTGLLILLLPIGLLLPSIALLKTYDRKKELKPLLTMLNGPQSYLLTIEEDPKTLRRTYKIQNKPQIQTLKIGEKKVTSILTSKQITIPKEIIKILQEHNNLKKIH
jgi:hypothetical protein